MTPDYIVRTMRRYETIRLPALTNQKPDAAGATGNTVIQRFLSLVDLDRIRQLPGKTGEETGNTLSPFNLRMPEQSIFVQG